ncbi:hypothetical protein NPIL_334541, partial [Nephila pilipes]
MLIPRKAIGQNKLSYYSVKAIEPRKSSNRSRRLKLVRSFINTTYFATLSEIYSAER